MAAKKVDSRKNKADYEDKFSVQLITRDKENLAQLVEKYILDLVHAEQTEKGELRATVYATQSQIAQLKKTNVKLQVGENQTEIGRKRQKEVSKEDRFKGGKITPKGLGTKK